MAQRLVATLIKETTISIFGVKLIRPGFWPLTQAIAIAVVLWTLLTFSPLGATSAVGVGANLAAILFGCISNAIGIDVSKGVKHLGLNIAGCVLVLVTYLVIASLFF